LETHVFNDRSRAAVDAAAFGPHFRRPLYSSYNFANIPSSLPWLFTGQGTPALPVDVFGSFAPPFDHVVLCFIDAFGWLHVEKALEHSRFLRHAVAHGVLSKMTSMFPSTTAAHVTTIHTNQPPSQSGVYAWQYFDPVVGTIFEPLPFSYYNQPREGLKITGIDLNLVYPGPSIYGELSDMGVRSTVMQPIEISGSSCNKVYTAGAEPRPFRSLAEGLVNLRELLLRQKGPAYTFFYWDKIDTLSHVYGPDSEQVAAEVEMVFLAFERILHERLGSAKRTLLLITADHGHVRTGTPFFVNQQMPDVVAAIQKDRIGRPLAPAGSRRDFFLYVQPENLEGVCGRLREALAGRAEVYPTSELIEAGFFGEGPASERFLARVGNVVVLPYANESVWWQEPGQHEAKVSSHGGLTPDEVDIPLFAVAYD
jgi:hypothetical protein